MHLDNGVPRGLGTTSMRPRHVPARGTIRATPGRAVARSGKTGGRGAAGAARRRAARRRPRILGRSAGHGILRLLWMGSAIAALSGMLVACMSGLYRVIEASQMFGLEAVEIVGNSRVGSQELLEKAGIGAGTNILMLDNEEVARRIESIPWVAHVSIIKRFPHELTIRITEREPIAVVALGGLWYVDREGVVFHRLGPEDRRDFPLLTGFSAEEAVTEEASPYEPMRKTVELLEMIQQYPGMVSVSEVNFDSARGWTVYPADLPVRVYLGFGEFEQKIIHLARVYHDVSRHAPIPEFVDLSFPYQVVLRKGAEGRSTPTTVKAIADKGTRGVAGPAT
jgi:cell division protein FtsQ